jgi:hypothetical protein
MEEQTTSRKFLLTCLTLLATACIPLCLMLIAAAAWLLL